MCLSQSSKAAFLLDAIVRCLGGGFGTLLVCLESGHICGVALQVDSIVTTSRRVNVSGKCPLAHTPIPNGTFSLLSHAVHLISAPIRLARYCTEIRLHLDTDVMGPGIIIPRINTTSVASEACQSSARS